jgi:hypothetical protein
MHGAQRTRGSRRRFAMPRWNFPPVSATGHLGSIGRVRFDESCKMIEFEVMLSPLKALAAQTEATGNRIGPELPRMKQEARVTVDFLGVLGPFRPCRALAPEGSLWQEPAACRGPLGPILLIRACCRSSVVEHSIGNGEVDSSILSGSTIHPTDKTAVFALGFAMSSLQGSKEPPRNRARVVSTTANPSMAWLV